MGDRARGAELTELTSSSAVHGAELPSLFPVQNGWASKLIKIIEKWMKIVDTIEMKCPLNNFSSS